MKHTLKQIAFHWKKMVEVIRREWELLNRVVSWDDDDEEPTGGCA